jgi:hypothetical protein
MAYIQVSAPRGAQGLAGAPPAPHPIQRHGLIFGAVAALIAVVQVGVSVAAALENRSTLTNLYFSAGGGDAAQASALFDTLRLLIAAYGTALVGFIFTLVLCWHAGRAAALETGRTAAGTEASLLVSATGALIWVVASVVAVLLFHTDGSLAGISTASAQLSPATDAREIAILVSQETVAVLFGLSAAALVGWLAGGSAITALRRVGTMPLPAPGSFSAAPWSPGAGATPPPTGRL